jgi:simple sugar transport system permease protein
MAGALAGAALAAPFAFLTQNLATNQVAPGLALTLLGLGLSGLIGEGFVGTPGQRLESLNVPGLSAIPLIGPLLFSHDLLVYLSFAMTGAVMWFLFRSRAGLILRAVGVNHAAAHALGHPVIRVRWLAILFGGVMAGLAGAYLSLAYTPQWTENMTAGRGWIALALVVFATWRPLRVLAGAYLFGAVWILGLHAQAAGLGLPSQLLAALPYMVTIAALAVISRNRTLTLTNTPASLGIPFVPDR